MMLRVVKATVNYAMVKAYGEMETVEPKPDYCKTGGGI